MAEYLLNKIDAGLPITDEDWIMTYYTYDRKNFYEDKFAHLELMLSIASANGINLRFVALGDDANHVKYIYGFLGFSFHWDKKLLSHCLNLIAQYGQSLPENINNNS